MHALIIHFDALNHTDNSQEPHINHQTETKVHDRALSISEATDLLRFSHTTL